MNGFLRWIFEALKGGPEVRQAERVAVADPIDLTPIADLVAQLFPSIHPYVAQRAKAALSQHDGAAHLYQSPYIEGLLQGDILSPLTILQTGEGGNPERYVGPGLMVSNSCDADRDDHILFAAGIPYSEFAGDGRLNAIARNEIFNFLCLPRVPSLGDTVVDLSLVHAIARAHVNAGLADGTIRKVASLSRLGWYLLITKLTVHFLRPETEDVPR